MRKILKSNKAQMLLLTGITVVLISISVVIVTSELSNLDSSTLSQETHPLHIEFSMIKDNILYLNSKGYFNGDLSTAEEKLDTIVQEIQIIEKKYLIHIDATLNHDETTGQNTIYLCLENSNTKICDEFNVNLR